jgi:TPR repeat protein
MLGSSRSQILGTATLVSFSILLASPPPAAAWDADGVPFDSQLTSELAVDRTKARAGDADAQYRLGEKYAHRQCVTMDDAAAARWFAKAAAQGHARAQNELGRAYNHGWGVAHNDTWAAAWFRKAAEQRFAAAQSNLAAMYASGLGIKRDGARAIVWLRKAADQGYAYAQYNLGLTYELGIGAEEDESRAIAWYRKAADQGLAEAQFALAEMNASGRDAPWARAWSRRLEADRQGPAAAQFQLELRRHEAPSDAHDDARDEGYALAWLRTAAEEGDAVSQYAMAGMYASGRGVPQDDARAVTWYRKAAKQGIVEAQYALDALQRAGRDGSRNGQ